MPPENERTEINRDSNETRQESESRSTPESLSQQASRNVDSASDNISSSNDTNEQNSQQGSHEVHFGLLTQGEVIHFGARANIVDVIEFEDDVVRVDVNNSNTQSQESDRESTETNSRVESNSSDDNSELLSQQAVNSVEQASDSTSTAVNNFGRANDSVSINDRPDENNSAGEITVYFRRAEGAIGSSGAAFSGDYPIDFGHTFIEVRDFETGENYYLDIWEENGEAIINRQLNNERRAAHESATWSVSRTSLDAAIQAIEERLLSNSQYELVGRSCVDSVKNVLTRAGYEINPNVITPSGAWESVIRNLPERDNVYDMKYTNLNGDTFLYDGEGHFRQVPIDGSPPLTWYEPNISDKQERYVPPPQ